MTFPSIHKIVVLMHFGLTSVPSVTDVPDATSVLVSISNASFNRGTIIASDVSVTSLALLALVASLKSLTLLTSLL